MKCIILHESKGRMRVRAICGRMTLGQADHLEYYLRAADGVTEVRVYDRTQDAVIFYEGKRSKVTEALAAFSLSLSEINIGVYS